MLVNILPQVVRERAIKRLSELQAAGQAQVKAKNEDGPRQAYLKKQNRAGGAEMKLEVLLEYLYYFSHFPILSFVHSRARTP